MRTDWDADAAQSCFGWLSTGWPMSASAAERLLIKPQLLPQRLGKDRQWAGGPLCRRAYIQRQLLLQWRVGKIQWCQGA